MARKTDVLLIIYDQLAACWLETALRGAADLPNFARLGSRGTYFSQTMSTNPVCSPARATIATGLSGISHGLTQLGYRLDPQIPTFMGAMAAAGWQTAACGKVHLVPHFDAFDPDYRPYGFQLQHITEDPRGGPWLEWVKTHHPEHFRAALTTVWTRNIPEFAKHGPDNDDLAALMEGLPMKEGSYELPFPAAVSQSNWITDRAVDLINNTPRKRAILNHVGYVQPHNPFAPPKGYRRFVDMSQVPEPLPAEWIDDPLGPRGAPVRAETAKEYEWRSAREHYFADLVHLDRQLGRLLDALDESGRTEQTLVIATADHGEMLLDHGLIFKDGYHYDACIRVPLFIAGPGLAQGQVRSDLVELADIYPTIMDAAGLELPKPPDRAPLPDHENVPFTAGRSLLPLARGESAVGWRDAAFIESYNNTDSRSPHFWVRTVRTDQARYSLYGDGGGEQLFDLRADPGEQTNLAGNPAHADLRLQMRDRLLDHLITAAYPHSPRGLASFGIH